MQRITSLFIALLVLSCIFWLLELLFAANPAQPRLRNRLGLGTDLIYWFMTPLFARAIARFGVGVILVLVYRQTPTELQAMLASRDTLLARQGLPLQALEMVVLGDFIGYWLHRSFHGRGLWPFHAVHHSSVHLDWLSSVRLHPVNDWLTRWVQASVLVVLGFSPLAVAAYVPFLSFYALLLHANVSWDFGPLRTVLASPRFHRWHHTSEAEGLNRNFAGFLPVFDILFGTWYLPRDVLPQHFGLDNETMPEGFFAQMLYPFRRVSASSQHKV